MASTEKHRLLSVGTPAGPDAFLLTGFSGKEEMSRPFRFELEMLSAQDAVAARDLVGQGVSWAVHPPAGDARHFHGVVCRFAAGPRDVRNLRSYRAVVVPWIWFLTRSVACRVFENQSTPEIVEALLGGLDYADYTFALTRPYPKRDLRVQYRETTFHFLSRLLEDEGVSYFFRHEEGRHTLVLADDASAYRDCPEKRVAYSPGVFAPRRVASWEHEYALRPGRSDFEPPDAVHPAPSPAPESEEAPQECFRGSSRCYTFAPGGKFTLEGHEFQEENRAYAVVAVEHAASDPSFTVHGGGREYRNTFTCVPDGFAYRPDRLTPPPAVRGPLTAVVAGREGEVAPVDDRGRVRVRFPWGDANRNEDGACWVRVAGDGDRQGEGSAISARAGQEVLVDFLAGDPDRPVLAVRSSDAARADGGEAPPPPDDADREVLSVHADRDYRRVVGRDDDLKVGRDQTIEIQKSRMEIVKEGDERVAIEKGNRTVVVAGDDGLRVMKGSREVVVEVGHDIHLVKTGHREVRVEAGNDAHAIGKGDRTVTIEMGHDTLTLKSGDQTTRLDLGTSTTEAMQAIELKVGPSRIRIEPTGISIEGMVVRIEGHAHTEVKGLMTQIGADAVLEVKGGATLVG